MLTRRRRGTCVNKVWRIFSPIAEMGVQCHNVKVKSTVRRIQRRADGYSALMVVLPPQHTLDSVSPC